MTRFRGDWAEETLTAMKRRKTANLGHVMPDANYGLLQLIIGGEIEGGRGIGRRKMSWRWPGLPTVEDPIHASRKRRKVKNVH